MSAKPHPNFVGVVYHTSENWHRKIPPTPDKPLRYAEVGVLHGANLISVALTYGRHERSTFAAIDPWEDYQEYPEYKGQQQENYRMFLTNIRECGIAHKTWVHREHSRIAFPKLERNFHDIIYIDGNHEPEAVLEDGVLAFRCLKPGGWLIFDDYGWGGPDLTQRGIDAFLSGYHKRLCEVELIGSQMFARKKEYTA